MLHVRLYGRQVRRCCSRVISLNRCLPARASRDRRRLGKRRPRPTSLARGGQHAQAATRYERRQSGFPAGGIPGSRCSLPANTWRRAGPRTPSACSRCRRTGPRRRRDPARADHRRNWRLQAATALRRSQRWAASRSPGPPRSRRSCCARGAGRLHVRSHARRPPALEQRGRLLRAGGRSERTTGCCSMRCNASGPCRRADRTRPTAIAPGSSWRSSRCRPGRRRRPSANRADRMDAPDIRIIRARRSCRTGAPASATYPRAHAARRRARQPRPWRCCCRLRTASKRPGLAVQDGFLAAALAEGRTLLHGSIVYDTAAARVGPPTRRRMADGAQSVAGPLIQGRLVAHCSRRGQLPRADAGAECARRR